MKSSVNGFTAQAIALAAALGLSLGGPHRAQAAPANPVVQAESGPEITILSPTPEASFSGVKPVEISAFYQGSSANQIVALELYVDGVKASQKILDVPETRGVVSFLVDASALSAGDHHIVVRATAADAEVTSAKTSFAFVVPDVTAPDTDTQAPDTSSNGTLPDATGSDSPRLSIQDLSRDGTVHGTVKIRVNAMDPSGKAPYVSLFIDRSWKSLRNYAPYDFDWDTTTSPNGYHTIEAFGYNDDQQVSQAPPMRVYVNNPGGRTERRTDLQDGPAPEALPAAAPQVAKRAVTHTAPAVSATRPVLDNLGNEQAVAPAKLKTAAKVAGTRRPTRGALVASRLTTIPLESETHSLQMARISDLAEESLALVGASDLNSPFADTMLPRVPKVTAREVRSIRAQSPVAEPKSVFTMPTEVGSQVQQHHVRIVTFRLPDESLVSPFTARPIAPVISRRMTTVGSITNGRQVMVAVPATQASERVYLHGPMLARRYNWLRAAGQTEVVFNSNWLALQRPLSARGSVLFGPLRQIFEADGGSLLWQARTGVVVGHDKDRDMRLTIGRKSATIDKAVVVLDKAPYVSKGRTMVPLSFIKAAMNVDVQYDPTSGHLSITNKD